MKWVILDRDGVINEDSDAYIKSPEEWEAIPGSLEAIELLTRHGYRLVVITNQSGIARGYFNEEVLAKIHAKMVREVEARGGRIEAIYHCPHGPEDFCECRKPKAGLYLRMAEDFSVNLHGVPAIGDSFRDLEAARSVGAAPMLVETGKGERTLKLHPNLDLPVFSNLYEAALSILQRHD